MRSGWGFNTEWRRGLAASGIDHVEIGCVQDRDGGEENCEDDEPPEGNCGSDGRSWVVSEMF